MGCLIGCPLRSAAPCRRHHHHLAHGHALPLAARLV